MNNMTIYEKLENVIPAAEENYKRLYPFCRNESGKESFKKFLNVSLDFLRAVNNENRDEIMISAGALYFHIMAVSSLKTEAVMDFTAEYEEIFLKSMEDYEKKRENMEYSLKHHINDTDSEENIKIVKENLNKNKEIYNVNYSSAVTSAHAITESLFNLDYSENRGRIMIDDGLTCSFISTLVMTLYAVKLSISECLEEYLLFLLKKNKKD